MKKILRYLLQWVKSIINQNQKIESIADASTFIIDLLKKAVAGTSFDERILTDEQQEDSEIIIMLKKILLEVAKDFLLRIGKDVKSITAKTIITILIEFLRSIPNEKRDFAYISLAGMLVQKTEKDEMKLADSILLTQYKYKQNNYA